MSVFCCLVLDSNLDVTCCFPVLPISLEIAPCCISTMNSAVPSFWSCQLPSEIALHCLFTMNTEECCHNHFEVRLIPSILYWVRVLADRGVLLLFPVDLEARLSLPSLLTVRWVADTLPPPLGRPVARLLSTPP